MYERFRATAVGALLGLTAYVAWLTGSLRRFEVPTNWHFSGPIKWFVIAGALIGFVGGISLVESLLDREKGELLDNSILNGLFVVAILAFSAVAFYSLRQ